MHYRAPRDSCTYRFSRAADSLRAAGEPFQPFGAVLESIAPAEFPPVKSLRGTALGRSRPGAAGYRGLPVNYPNIRQSLFLMLVVLGLQILFSRLNGVMASFFGYPLNQALSAGVVNLAAFAGVLSYALKFRGGRFFSAYEVKGFDGRILTPLVLMTFGLAILLSEASNLTQALFPMPKSIASVMSSLRPEANAAWISILTLSVVAPLTEELFFRGLLLKGLLGVHPRRTSMVVSALFFALFHLNPWQFLGAFVAGLFFAWLFVRYGSVLPCVLAHALNNFIPILVTYLLRVDIPGFTSPLDARAFQPAWFDLAGAGLVLASVALFFLIGRRAQPKMSG